MIDNIFIVSLPRTGTTTLCKMGKLVGYKPKHVPLLSLDDMVAGNSYNFFADTPCFSVDHITNYITDNNKFIYIQKDPTDWFKSWEKVGLLATQHIFTRDGFKPQNSGQIIDRDVYISAMGNEPITEKNYRDVFYNHADRIKSAIPHNKLLIYDLRSGWEPFCKFLEVDTPTESIPHLNQNTMFEKI